MSNKKGKERKEDTSPKIQQRDKFKNDLYIREFNWNSRQKELISSILNKNTNVTFIKGPAGSSKTLCSVYCGLKLLANKSVSQIIHVRNPVESSSYSLGYIKGDICDKFSPYEAPMNDKLNELLTKPDITALINDNRIISIPLGFMRGLSLRNSYIIIEEATNLTIKDLLLVITRLGATSRMVLSGDIRQIDIKNSGFNTVYNLFDNQESKDKGINTISFNKEDIFRNPILSFIIEKFESLQN